MILEIQYLFILSQVLIWEKYWIGVIQVARGIETLGYWIFIIGVIAIIKVFLNQLSHIFTAENCGQYSVTRGGYWDYCKFKSTSEPDWVAKSWKEKTDMTMKRVYDFGPSLGRPTQFDSK